MMQKLYTLALALCLATAAAAQTVTVPPNLNNDNGFVYTELIDFIESDTSATGDQLHDVYLLEAGGLYFFKEKAEWDFDVTLRATGDVATFGRPVVDRINVTGGTSLGRIYEGFGSITFDGLYMVLGEEGPDAAAYETSPIRPRGDNQRYVFNDCVVLKSRQGTMRIEGMNAVAVLTNNHIYNFGDYEKQQGNGRLVDPRTNFIDSVIIRNNYVHNILDRLYIGLRSPGGGYFDFSNNTVFNHVGRHGLIQLGYMQESHINDNIFYNTQVLGTSEEFANEQITYKDQVIYMFSIDTMGAGFSAEMRNNAIHWSPEVQAMWASVDGLDPAQTISPELATMIGDTSNSIIRTEIQLGNVPAVGPIVDYARESFLYPDSTGITDIMVEDPRYVALPGNAGYDNGYLFDFSTFDPCLAEGSPLRTASTGGGGVGATWLCDYASSGVRDVNYNVDLGLAVRPNPVDATASLSFRTRASGLAELKVYDFNGKLMRTLHEGFLAAGEHRFDVDGLGELANGMYFVNLRTPEGRMFRRLNVQH